MMVHPILMDAESVRGLAKGVKTQTRRIVRPQPPTTDQFPHSVFGLDRAIADGVVMYSQNQYKSLPKHPTDWELTGSVGVARDAGFPMRYRCPFGKARDLLWVREPMFIKRPQPGVDWRETGYCYEADCGNPVLTAKVMKRRVSMHMPRDMNRFTLKVTDVRVQRLQDISDADSVAEGIEEVPDGGGCANCGLAREKATMFLVGSGCYDGEWVCSVECDQELDDLGCPHERNPSVYRYASQYRRRWEGLHGPGSWDLNPWVWAVTFHVMLEHIDSVLRKEQA